MGCDMLVVPGRDTVDGRTIFGHNCGRPVGEIQVLRRVMGRCHAPGEKTGELRIPLPQICQTFTVLASQPAGTWGYNQGVNEHGVAAGWSLIQTKLTSHGPGLSGCELVRLALERSRTARQAVDIVADLISRHGIGAAHPTPTLALTMPSPPLRGRGLGEGDRGMVREGDWGTALLIADPNEAFVIEGGGMYWVCQEVCHVRAVSNVGTIRQDWDHIAPGLAQHAIGAGWWTDDGSKIDFVASVCPSPSGRHAGSQRWRRASHLLVEQKNRIDLAFARRVLSDHYEECEDEADISTCYPNPMPICQHVADEGGTVTAVSFLAQLTTQSDSLPLAWCAYGPPCASIYFPIFLDGELPASFGLAEQGAAGHGVWQRMHDMITYLAKDSERWEIARTELAYLQTEIDQQTDEFVVEKAASKRQGELAELQRQIGLFMEHILERFDKTLARVPPPARSKPRVLLEPT